jgi:hypothetical protein
VKLPFPGVSDAQQTGGAPQRSIESMDSLERPGRTWLVLFAGATVLALFFSTQNYLYYCLMAIERREIHVMGDVR